jgi:hypothetical protein
LGAVAGHAPSPGAFARLCGLSAVRPAPHGLALHDDVRRILGDDLRWRDPGRAAALRLRALAHFRERARAGPPAEREWLLAERLALWEDAFAQGLLFGHDAPPGEVRVEPGRPEDHADVERVWGHWQDQALAATGRPAFDRDVDRAFLRALLGYPGTRLRVARGREGGVLGFNTAVPVCRESAPILDLHPGITPAVRAYCGEASPAGLPASPAQARVVFLVHLAHVGVYPETTRAALLRDLVAVLAGGGTYLASTPVPDYKQLLELMGWELLPAARNWFWADDVPTDGYVLDLARTGLEPWVAALLDGRRPPRGLAPEELEGQLQALLPHWRDDARLARSPLWDAGPLALVPGDERGAERLRAEVRSALERAKAVADADEAPGLRAVELALTRGVSHEAAAERLAVSRATLYRLHKRGVRGLARALANP